MSGLVFPDNTVLCNFGAVDRLDLLRDWLRGRGRWCEAVAYEAALSARGIPALAQIPREGWLGEPVELDDRAAVEVDRIRRVAMGGTPDRPLQHLGEAQTCYLIRHVASFSDSWWVSDDQHSLRYARGRQIRTYETIDVMSMVVSDGDLTSRQAMSLMNDMADHGRGLRLPRSERELGP